MKIVAGTEVYINSYWKEKGILLEDVNNNSDFIGVKFKTYNPSRHTCRNKCEHGYGWYCRQEVVEVLCKRGKVWIPIKEAIKNINLK